MNEFSLLKNDLTQDQEDKAEAVFGSNFDPDLFPRACPSDTSQAGNPNRLYGLDGVQVDPEAGAWTTGPRPLPSVVPLSRVLELTAPGGMFPVRPWSDYNPYVDIELEELRFLQSKRDTYWIRDGRPTYFDGTYAYPAAYRDLDSGVPDIGTRLPISDFIQLDPSPFGTIFNIGTRHQISISNINQQHLRRERYLNGNLPPVVRTGRELARMFESETPGLLHRQALFYEFYKRPEISPPRQARVYMALEVTLYSALVAAWAFKWHLPSFRYRQRPYEYDRDQTLRVVFDDVVGDRGRFSKCARLMPCPSPGTPRHPAYPSGHSTYSAAASEILKYFFRDADTQTQLDRLANNIGTARLWAGVHWRSDHTAGVQIGRAVAFAVKEQLEADCIARFDEAPNMPPQDPDALRAQAEQRRQQATCQGNQDLLPPQRRDEFDDCTPDPMKVQVF